MLSKETGKQIKLRNGSVVSILSCICEGGTFSSKMKKDGHWGQKYMVLQKDPENDMDRVLM